MKENLIKINGIVVPTIQNYSKIWEDGDYIAEDGIQYRLKRDKDNKNVIGTDASGNQIVKPLKSLFGSVPFSYKTEYEDCKALYSKGINIEELDKKFSDDIFKLIEVYDAGMDLETGKEAFKIVWEKSKSGGTVGVDTNGNICFGSGGILTIKEMEKFIEIAQYLLKNYKG